MAKAQKIPASEARNNFSELISKVEYQGQEFLIERYGEIVAKLVPVEVKKAQVVEETEPVQTAAATPPSSQPTTQVVSTTIDSQARVQREVESEQAVIATQAESGSSTQQTSSNSSQTDLNATKPSTATSADRYKQPYQNGASTKSLASSGAGSQPGSTQTTTQDTSSDKVATDRAEIDALETLRKLASLTNNKDEGAAAQQRADQPSTLATQTTQDQATTRASEPEAQPSQDRLAIIKKRIELMMEK